MISPNLKHKVMPVGQGVSVMLRPFFEQLDNWVMAVAAVKSDTDSAGLKAVDGQYSPAGKLSPTIQNGLRVDSEGINGGRIGYFKAFAPGVTDAIWKKPTVTRDKAADELTLSGDYFFHKDGSWVKAEYSFTFKPEATGPQVHFHTSRIFPQPDRVEIPDEDSLDPALYSKKIADFEPEVIDLTSQADNPSAVSNQLFAAHLDSWVDAVKKVTSAEDSDGLAGVNGLYREHGKLSPTIQNGLRVAAEGLNEGRTGYFKAFAPGVDDAVWGTPEVTRNDGSNELTFSGDYFFHKDGSWVAAEYTFTCKPGLSGPKIQFHTSRIHPQQEAIKKPGSFDDLDAGFSRKFVDLV